MLKFIIIFASMVLIIKAVKPIFHKKRVIIGLVKAINKVYINFLRQQSIIGKIIVFGMIAISAYMVGSAFYYKVTTSYYINDFQSLVSIIGGLLIIAIVVYFSVGTPMLILGRVTRFLANIGDEEISWNLLISHSLLIMYGYLLIIDKVEVKSLYILILTGLLVAYFLNLQVLFRITINPLRFTLKSNRVKDDKGLLLCSIWIGAFLLICIIVLNLFLGVITINNANPMAYSNSNGGAITNFDLFYYTLITFTTIGYGDISPVVMESKIMAIIIAITSVVCLVVMMSSILSLKDKILDD